MAFGVASSVAYTAPTLAQEESTDEGPVEKISVTGSRIQRTDLETSSPIQITSDVEIKLSGFTRIEDLMNSLPQVEANQTSQISNGASGTANLDLRGLGPTRTLVLVNGRRLQPGGHYSYAPDINQIPTALVKRIETLTGGAGATYGADAVAGVVNFIMDEDFEGVELVVGASAYQHDNDNSYIQGLMDERGFEYPTGDSGFDGSSFNFDFTIGSDFANGKGHATGYVTYRKDNELRQESRDYSSCALNSAGTSCGGSGNAIVPNFYVSAPTESGAFDWTNYDYWTLDSDSSFIASEGNLYNYAPINHFQRPDKRFTLGAFVDYEINEHAKPYLEVMYMSDSTRAQIAESGTFFAENYLIEYDSELLNDTQRAQLTEAFGLTSGDSFATYIGKRNVEGGPRSSNMNHNSMRFVTGVEGIINDNWSYDASITYGQTNSTATYINDFFSDYISAALDYDTCSAADDCIPYEVFTYQGITAEQADGLTGTATLTGATSQFIVNGYVTGETGIVLPTSDLPIAAVLGFEYREDSFERISDEVYEKGLLLGQGGPTESVAGSYDVSEVFAEVSIPVLENLNVDLVGRASDFSSVGNQFTYKIGADWEFVEDYMLRMSYNETIRAPNAFELYAPQSVGLWSGTDPCAGDEPEFTEAQCANTGVTSAQYGNIAESPASQYNSLSGGNPDLDAEKGETFTLGLVANVTEDLNFSVDYWTIEMTDVIDSIAEQTILTQCGETGASVYCDNINRSASGSLWVGETGYVIATELNLAERNWEGVDIEANYEYSLDSGSIVARLIGTYFMTKEYVPLPGDEAATYDCAGYVTPECLNSSGNAVAQPDWRHTLTLTYASDSFWSVQAKWRYFSEVDYELETDELLAGKGISAQSYLDLKGTFEVNDYTSLLVGVNNALDKEPPMVGGTLSSNGNAIAGFYDTLGRYFHASATFKF